LRFAGAAATDALLRKSINPFCRDFSVTTSSKTLPRVLHVARMRTAAVGVARQMAEEQAAAKEIGIPWDVRLYVPQGKGVNDICVDSEVPAADKRGFARRFYYWLDSQAAAYDLIVLRHSVYTFDEGAFIARSPKPVFLVHHTLEVPELRHGRGRLGPLLAVLESASGARALRRAAGAIVMTPEIGRYEQGRVRQPLPTFVYPNGLRTASARRFADRRDAGLPELLFVASEFVPWHGLDLVVAAAGRSSAAFRVHLVGKLSDAQLESVQGDSRFVVHGVLDQGGIAAVADACTVGLGSFALERKDMRQACTLKVREYLAGGLPVYAGHEDVFPAEFPYFKHGNADFSSILRYAHEMAGKTRDEVTRSSVPYIDKARLLAKLYGELQDRMRVDFGGVA